MKNCNRTRNELNRNVVIPMSTFVINANEYATELTGVVPRVDTIEKPTPNDIMNKPIAKRIILLIIQTLLRILNYKNIKV